MKKIFLFDLDGTLAESAQIINDDMIKQLDILKKNGHEIGIVGGGDFIKMCKQINNKITIKFITIKILINNHYFHLKLVVLLRFK